MKTGMNLLLWTPAANQEHFAIIKQIKQWGFDGVELPMFSIDGSPWKEIAKVLHDLGLGATAVAVLPQDASLIASSKDERQRGLDFLKGCIDACAQVGAQVLGGPIYHPVAKFAGRGRTEDEWKRCVESLKEVGLHAQEAGVAVAVEPLNRFEAYFLNCQSDGADLAKAVGVPSVGVLHDTFHANIEEKSITAAIEAAGPYIKLVHISANDRATPGEDHVHWADTFATLKQTGFDGWYVIEAFGKWLPEIASTTCIWREMAPSAEHIAREGLRFIQESTK